MDDGRGPRERAHWKRGAGVAMVAGFALVASGCFSDPVTLKVVAKEDFSNQAQPFDFDQDTYIVPRGELNVVYAFPTGVAPHTLRIRDSEALDLAVNATTRADEGTIELAPGTYELYCSVVNPSTGAAHADLGMTAELLVL
jgi:hypothetical protein